MTLDRQLSVLVEYTVRASCWNAESRRGREEWGGEGRRRSAAQQSPSGLPSTTTHCRPAGILPRSAEKGGDDVSSIPIRIPPPLARSLDAKHSRPQFPSPPSSSSFFPGPTRCKVAELSSRGGRRRGVLCKGRRGACHGTRKASATHALLPVRRVTVKEKQKQKEKRRATRLVAPRHPLPFPPYPQRDETRSDARGCRKNQISPHPLPLSLLAPAPSLRTLPRANHHPVPPPRS
jgi:hypothetical protein